MTTTQIALLRLLVQAVNTFLAAMREPYRVNASDVRTSKRGNWLMIGLPIDKRAKP